MMMNWNIICASCGESIGCYEGEPFYILAQRTIGGSIVYVLVGSYTYSPSGNVDGKILCTHCLGKEHPGTIERERRKRD